MLYDLNFTHNVYFSECLAISFGYAIEKDGLFEIALYVVLKTMRYF